MSLFASSPAGSRLARVITGRVHRSRARRHAAWDALMSNAPDALTAALTARFEASERAAAVVAVRADTVEIALSLPPVDEAVPATNLALAADGALTIRAATTSERAEWYRQFVGSQILFVAEECFTAGPLLADVTVVAAYAGQPLVAATLSRATLDHVDWGQAPWDVLTTADPAARYDDIQARILGKAFSA
jgi:hypothetical protein